METVSLSVSPNMPSFKDYMGVKSTISVIIPAHRTGTQLNQCLQSIIDFGNEVNEVILVFDGIPQLSPFIPPDIPGLRIEQLTENQGPSAARNHGARKAFGDILLFIDSDVQLLPESIEQIKRHFEAPDATEAVIGSYDVEPFETTIVSRYRNLLHHHTHQNSSSEASTFWGACGAIKKKVFQAIGGFDTSFEKPSVEDIELGYRLVQNGYKISLNRTLEVKHLKKWTFLNMVRTDIFYRARPWTRLLYQYQKLDVDDLNVNYKERLAVFFFMTGIMSLLISSQSNVLLLVSLISFLMLIITKRKIYQFFAKHFKWYQLPLTILLHWSYLSCALIGFVLGTVDSLFSKKKAETTANINERLTVNE